MIKNEVALICLAWPTKDLVIISDPVIFKKSLKLHSLSHVSSSNIFLRVNTFSVIAALDTVMKRAYRKWRNKIIIPRQEDAS